VVVDAMEEVLWDGLPSNDVHGTMPLIGAGA
jgi:hypothetical protein